MAALDSFLASYVETNLNRTTGNFTISVLVGGTWISGLAISERSWFEIMGAVVDGVAGGDRRPGDMFRAGGVTLAPSDSEIEAGYAEPRTAPIFALHLRDARTGNPPDYDTAGFMIRVRLEDVQAWALGLVGSDTTYDAPPPPL